MDETAALTASLALAVAAGCQARSSTQPARLAAAPGPPPAKSEADTAAVQPPSPRDIHHLLSRLTFGWRMEDAEQVRALGIDAWLEQQIGPTDLDSGAETAVTPFRLALAPPAEVVKSFAGDETQDTTGFDWVELEGKTYKVDANRVIEHAQMAQIARQISADRQLEEVMVAFWTNHFNVFVRKGKVKLLGGHYVETAIRPHALGRFEDLLIATASHPAMLLYLDNAMSVTPVWSDAAGQRSGQKKRKKRGLNENYARELLELHTVGVDAGYTQADVTEVARIFSGWGLKRGKRGASAERLEFAFSVDLHDLGDKRVLGQLIPSGAGVGRDIEEGLTLLRFLARHPATARHIARKLCRRFIADSPPEPAIDAVAKAFLESAGDIKAVLRALVKAPEFWDERARGAKLKTPSEFLASALRVLGATSDTTTALVKVSKALGEPPLLQPVPTGYRDQAEAWTGGSQMLARMQLAVKLAEADLPGTRLDLSSTLATAKDPADLVERVNRLVFGGTARPDTLRVISERIRNLGSPEEQRTVALALALGSPEFQYQ